jgi:hypothetical protein
MVFWSLLKTRSAFAVLVEGYCSRRAKGGAMGCLRKFQAFG